MGPCQGHFRLYLTNSTKVNSLEVVKFGSMDKVELHGDILQPGGQLETPGLVICDVNIYNLFSHLSHTDHKLILVQQTFFF